MAVNVRVYRKLPCGRWKYSEGFNHTQDPNCQAYLSRLKDTGQEYELRDAQGFTFASSEQESLDRDIRRMHRASGWTEKDVK